MFVEGLCMFVWGLRMCSLDVRMFVWGLRMWPQSSTSLEEERTRRLHLRRSPRLGNQNICRRCR